MTDLGTATRRFLVRATASAGYRLTRASGRLDRRPEPSDSRSETSKTLVGERDVEWAWTLAHLHQGVGRILDFGSGNGMLALAASFAGNEAIAVDLEAEQYLFTGHNIRYIRGDFNQLEWEPRSFDQILNCSSIEHVGISGRYGSPDEEDGDLKAMQKLAGLVKRDGNMVLSIPLGLDGVYPPWHRVYGETRLSALLDAWVVRKESYWAKRDDEKYEPISRSEALAEVGSATYYALGLYVVTPK
jgi:SAM-dependent methyltransferase